MDAAQLGAELLAALQQKGWNAQRSATTEPLLPPDVQARYPRLPAELTSFLSAIESCANAEENVWFLCREDYRRTDGEGFRWNEFELMALEREEDAALQQQVRGFWDRHFPFMLAVHSDYDYLAVQLAGPTAGSIVHGAAPDWEEPSLVARSFDEFLRQFAAEATSADAKFPFSVFL